MPLRIPARNVGGDQIMESVTNANTREEQVVRVAGTFPLTATTGTINTSTGTVTATNTTNAGTALILVYGTHAGLNLTFEALNSSGGNTNWVQVAASRTDTGTLQSVTGVLPANLIAAWRLPVARVDQLRVRATAYTSGTLNVIIDPAVPFGEPVVNAIMSNPPNAQQVSLTPAAAGISLASITEALLTMVPTRNFTAAGTTGTHVVTAGRTLRVFGFQFSFRGVAATATSANVYLRVNTAGTVTTTSPIALALTAAVPATANSHVNVNLPPGQFVEIPSGAGFGISGVLTTANAGSLVWPFLNGIEF